MVKLVDHILVKIATVTNGRDQKGYKRLLDFIMIAVTTGMRKKRSKIFNPWIEGYSFFRY